MLHLVIHFWGKFSNITHNNQMWAGDPFYLKNVALSLFDLYNTCLWKCIVTQTKGNVRTRAVDANRDGKGQKTIFKESALHQLCTNGGNSRPRSGRPTKIRPDERHLLTCKIPKEPRTTLSNLRPPSFWLKLMFCWSIIMRIMNNSGVHFRHGGTARRKKSIVAVW